jgi:hypothetical protein
MANKYTANPTDVKNFTTSTEVNLTQDFQDYSEFLPSINRTESIQRFFGSTVNQLLSSGSTQSIDTYWGRLAGKNYNPNNELFNPENDAKRLNYQFQPGVSSRKNGVVTQTTSYVNWLSRIESQGADLNNHDRLFSEPGYVFDAPIDSDKFVNYNNYYWIEGNMPLLEIEPTPADPIDIDAIVRQSQFTTPTLANFKTVEFVTGLRIQFKGPFATSASGEYSTETIYYVENVGGRNSIKLLEIVAADGTNTFPTTTPYEVTTPEGWDTYDWDSIAWDGIAQSSEYTALTYNKSYIVMERWASDKNPWARSNKWFSLYALQISTTYNDISLEAYLNIRTRASRPIIEFHANIELYDFCKNYVGTVDYAITHAQKTELDAGPSTYTMDGGNHLQNGDRLLVTADFPDEEAVIVSGVGTAIVLTPAGLPYNNFVNNDYVLVTNGNDKGNNYCFNGAIWRLSQNKTSRGAAPLFTLYTGELVALTEYTNTDFVGETLFSYTESMSSPFDRELGLNPSFTDQGSFSNFQFEWSLNNTRYGQNVKQSTVESIVGLYFWHDWVENTHLNGWSNIRGGQRVPIIQTQVADGETAVVFDLGTTAISTPTEFTVAIDDQEFRWSDHSYIDQTAIGYINPEFIWKYDTDYTINDLVLFDDWKLEMTDPHGNADANISYTGAGNVKTFNVSSDYEFDKVLYRKGDDAEVFGEIFLTNANQNRYTVTRNGQQLIDGDDFTFTETVITIDVATDKDDVIELRYVADADLTNVVYDVDPVHFYNSDNQPFTGAGYDDLINHFTDQLLATPGFVGKTKGNNNYHKTVHQNTHGGLIRQQRHETKKIHHLMDQESINPLKALKTFADDYTTFKTTFCNKVRQLWTTESWSNVRDIVDRAINDINIGKDETFKYAHSDMAYFKQHHTATYADLDGGTTFAMHDVVNLYGNTKNHVQAWITESGIERPLVLGIDYSIVGSDLVLTTPAAGTSTDLVIRWFDYTQDSHVPYSAVKLGFYRPTQIEIDVNNNLIGHDGSRTQLTGTDITDITSANFDVVGAALWDFELRVYNNLVDDHFVGDDMQSFYLSPVSEFAYNITDINTRLDDWFNRYAVRNNITDLNQVAYSIGDEFTWNYNSVGPLLGGWRSLYVYNFGTDRPHTHPWEMLGHNIKPSWWDATYSWTAGSLRDDLLRALQYGRTGNTREKFKVNTRFAHANYDWATDTLVSDDGNATLNGPVTANVVTAPSSAAAQRQFVFGDWGDVENEWRTNSEYSFALAEVFLQLKPYRIHDTFWKLGRLVTNRVVTQEQWTDTDTGDRTSNDELHNQLISDGVISKIIVTNPGSGYTYAKIEFSADDELINTPTATLHLTSDTIGAATLTSTGRGINGIPTVTIKGDGTGLELEYVLDYKFRPTYLGFNTLPSEEFTILETDTNQLSAQLARLDIGYMLHVGGFTDQRILSVELDGDFASGKIKIPDSSYHILIDQNAPIKTVFYSGVKIEKIEGGYIVDGYNLDSKFFNYNSPSTSGTAVQTKAGNIELTKHLNWRNEVTRIPYRTIIRKRQALYEFLLGLGHYYDTVGFDVNTRWEEEAYATIVWAMDNTITDPYYVNGINDKLTYKQGDHGIVQTIDTSYNGSRVVVDQERTAVRRNELLVLRNNDTTELSIKSGADRLYGIGIDVVEYEHIIVIDNTTEFNDRLYQPEIGIGQHRVKLIGERTRNWNGRVEAPGYLVQDRGLVVNIESSIHELETEWVTSESKAFERLTRQTIGFNVGFAKPSYMTNLFVGDKSSYQFEKGQRKYKGTADAIQAMTRNKNIFGTEFGHELYEEWMVRLGDFGDKTEREPLQFAINPIKIKTEPQTFRFSDVIVIDDASDLITDIHVGDVDSISGNFKNPFEVYDVLPHDNTSITVLENYQAFSRDAGLPLMDEIDNFLGTIDDIGDVYDPTADYALIPNWSEVAAYVQGDQVRYNGTVNTLQIASTGSTNVLNNLVIRGTQVFPLVENGQTFIANGVSMTFTKVVSTPVAQPIIVDGSVTTPTIPGGDTLILDNINVNFIKNETTTNYSDIVLDGNVTSPTITNTPSRQLTVFHAESAGDALTSVVVDFNETLPTLTIQQIWERALTAAGATAPSTKTSARVTALENLRDDYVTANTVAAWETFITDYYDTTVNPTRFVNPEYLGIQVAANLGETWETSARTLITQDLDLLTDLAGTHAETVTTMVSGRGSFTNAATFDSDIIVTNNLLDFDVTATDVTENLESYLGYVIINGGEIIALGTEVTVANPTEYVVDNLNDIATKITAALLSATAPAGITATTDNNRINLIRSSNTVGNRLGVEIDTDLGFVVDDSDVATSGTTTTSSVDLTLNEAVTMVNNASITGVTAQVSDDAMRIVSTNAQLSIGNGTANNDLGYNVGTTTATIITNENPVDLAIGDLVSQINIAAFDDLVASQVEGTLILTYSGITLVIGDGTSNTAIGINAATFESTTTDGSNTFNLADWSIDVDPAHFNIWTIDNIGSDPIGVTTPSNRYNVYQTVDFQIGIIEICAGAETGDDAYVKTDKSTTLSLGEYVLIINSTCVPNVDGIHQVMEIVNDTGFTIDRYIEQAGYTGKVIPLREVRFANSVDATASMVDARYVQGTLGLRAGDTIYVDSQLDGNNNSLGYGAVYVVKQAGAGIELELTRAENGKTNNSNIKNGILFSNATGETVVNYEVYDPLKGIIPGIADNEIDFRSDVDFAYYNNTTDPELELTEENTWGQEHVGKVWWDIRNAIYTNYDQGTPAYRQAHWGELFPTATIDVYEWTKSSVTPDEYLNAVAAGTVIDGIELTGIPYAIVDQYNDLQYNWCEEIELNSNTNQIETYFYFWVSNKTTTPTLERQYSVLQLSAIIRDPAIQQVDWLAATGNNTLIISSLANTKGFEDLVMQVNFDTLQGDYHQEFIMLAENDPTLVIPEWLHISLRDSLVGHTSSTTIVEYAIWNLSTTYVVDEIIKSNAGNFFRCHTQSVNNNPDSNNNNWTLLEVAIDQPDGDYNGVDIVELNQPRIIPDRKLHQAVRYGLHTRPHQTWFKSISKARQVAVEKLNEQLSHINLTDSTLGIEDNFNRVFNVGMLEYNIADYWDLVDWSRDGFIYKRGVGDYFINTVADLATLDPSENEIAQVLSSYELDGRSRRSVWRYQDSMWVIQYKENATIAFSSLLWSNITSAGGWDLTTWDTDEWDKGVGAVISAILDSFFNYIWVNEYNGLYAEFWFHLAKHVLHEQNEVDWLFKSSYVKLITEDSLEKQYNRYFADGADDFFDYVNTVKPFHTKLREAIVRKTADDTVGLAAHDALEMRIQTNPEDDIIDETNTRSFRLSFGNNDLGLTDHSKHYSSQIINANKALLATDIGPEDKFIPYIVVTSAPFPASGAVWINGERIEYTGTVNSVPDEGVGSGFSRGFDSGFGGPKVLVGVTRGTQGTFARSHKYADIIEGETSLTEQTALSGYGTTTDGQLDQLSPAWNELGNRLLSPTNADSNGTTIRGNGFGTIDAYGVIFDAQWTARQRDASDIEGLSDELSEFIEVYWATI